MDAFLAEINLAQHATILDKLGYDDPNDFAEFEASDLEKLETRCVSEGMPPAHVDKLVHRIAPGHHLGVHHVACVCYSPRILTLAPSCSRRFRRAPL